MNIATVEVLTGSGVANEFEIIVEAVPIDFGTEAHTALAFCGKGGDDTGIALILIGIGCGIEGVGSVGLLAIAGLKVYSKIGSVIDRAEVRIAA